MTLQECVDRLTGLTVEEMEALPADLVDQMKEESICVLWLPNDYEVEMIAGGARSRCVVYFDGASDEISPEDDDGKHNIIIFEHEGLLRLEVDIPGAVEDSELEVSFEKAKAAGRIAKIDSAEISPGVHAEVMEPNFPYLPFTYKIPAPIYDLPFDLKPGEFQDTYFKGAVFHKEDLP